MLIARRADTRARADFATWKMLAKLNGTSSLSAEAQNFLGNYKNLLEQMPEAEATEATIKLMYTSYYAEMGGAGTPPEVPRSLAPVGPRERQRHHLPPAARQAEGRRIRVRMRNGRCRWR